MTKHKRGFSIIEGVVGIAILALVVVLAGGMISQLKRVMQISTEKTQASMVIEEGFEATKAIQKQSFSSLINGTYGLATTTGQWSLSGSSDTVSGKYKREIIISDVVQDKKQIISRVTWTGADGQKTIEASTFLTNYVAPVGGGGDGGGGGGNWSNPDYYGYVDLTDNDDARAIFVTSSKVYLATNGQHLEDFFVIDVSNIASPYIYSGLDLGSKGTEVFAQNSYAYVTTGNQSKEFQIINIANPNNLILTGYLNIPGNEDALGVYVTSTKAYVVTDKRENNKEFFIVNVTNPAGPSILGSLEINAKVNAVAVSGNYAFVATDDDAKELQIINIQNPASPTVIKSLNLPSSANAVDVKVSGTKAYVATNNNSSGAEFYVIDISNVQIPSIVGSLNIGDDAISLSIFPNYYAYLATDVSNKELQIVNIASTTPSIASTYRIDEHIRDVFYDSNLVYMATENNNKELQILKPGL